MASTPKKKEIVSQVPDFINVYSDGTIERLDDKPKVPPSPLDPQTCVSSKDIFFSNDPSFKARLYLPKLTQNNQKIPILVYFHGGAFCCESPFASHHHKYCNVVASQGKVLIFSIEYRRAPEHFIPTQYDDCWVGLKWVASQNNNETKDPTNCDPWIINHGDFNRVFIGGDSSGGNIVHNIAIRAGAEELPCGVKIFGAYMNHPFFWGSKPIGFEKVEEFEKISEFANLLWNFVYPNAPGGIDNPMVNPLDPKAPNLATLGCSKMLITVGGKDRFRNRTVLYYEAVKQSEWKGEVELFEDEDEDHCYYMFDLDSEKGKIFIKILADFLHL
ncbi:2-hydroxyisoflavanone dehydratase-like [Cicer arietinum]|uniref:2-hydroxyisoflavanone dehydratase-like n=1 Tax=Cicer arietinum TaxID=3827 RepID=A0A1S2YXD0_CICAR|nr:2-hydroxyisoflavanone dehydratase-like [Cicer arietinum]